MSTISDQRSISQYKLRSSTQTIQPIHCSTHQLFFIPLSRWMFLLICCFKPFFQKGGMFRFFVRFLFFWEKWMVDFFFLCRIKVEAVLTFESSAGKYLFSFGGPIAIPKKVLEIHSLPFPISPPRIPLLPLPPSQKMSKICLAAAWNSGHITSSS